MISSYGLLLILSTLWGASYAFLKLGVETIPSIPLIAWVEQTVDSSLATMLNALALGVAVVGLVALHVFRRKMAPEPQRRRRSRA